MNARVTPPNLGAAALVPAFLLCAGFLSTSPAGAGPPPETPGRLSYVPVLRPFHNKPSPTFKIDLGADSVVATGIHRFWKAGHGWAMARDLKPGDVLRTVGGTVRVGSVVTQPVQPVYNLEVGNTRTFFVGGPGLLVHDNSLVNPVPSPFDAEPAVADLAPTVR